MAYGVQTGMLGPVVGHGVGEPDHGGDGGVLGPAVGHGVGAPDHGGEGGMLGPAVGDGVAGNSVGHSVGARVVTGGVVGVGVVPPNDEWSSRLGDPWVSCTTSGVAADRRP